MPDPISPLGSQGSSPPVTYTAPAQAPATAGVQGGSIQTTVVTAAVQEIRHAAKAAQAERQDKVTLSSQPQKSVDDKLPHEMTLAEASEAFQKYLESLPSDLVFQPDYTSNMVVFKVVNPVTQKVIRQYPPEDVVRLARQIRQAEAQGRPGILLDSSY